MHHRLTLLLTVLLLPYSVAMAQSGQEISLPMAQEGAGGYYLRGVFTGGIESELLVDTGSSYVVLSRETFQGLKREGSVVYRRAIQGNTAAGRRVEAKVYAVAELVLGEGCILRDVEAVTLPGADRDILGLSALRQLGSFAIQFEPAMLTVSVCDSHDNVTLAEIAGELPAPI
ncbi:MAG: retropepsin-like aspartic protease [Gammaproteobacteria bacterium]|jgi:predicted aspartyl protease